MNSTLKKSKPTGVQRNKISTLIIGGILLFSLVINSKSFYMHHATGDQLSYVGVAMKIDKYGFEEYNLKRINMGREGSFIKYYYSEKDEDGDLLKLLERKGVIFYKQPLFHTPPLFSYLIVFFHRLFAPVQPYLVVPLGIDSGTKIACSEDKLSAQFYCTIVPILSNLLFIIVCFLLGKILFSTWVGIFSAILISISPISILASERLWADETLSFFIALVVLLYYLAIVKNQRVLIVLSGFVYGLALLTKNSALILIIAIISATYLYKRHTERELLKANINLGIFFLTAFLIALPWYITVTKIFGSPIHTPYQEGISKTAEWFIFNNSRPWYTFLVGIPFQIPIYSVGYLAMFGVILGINRNRDSLFLTIWFLSFLIILTYTTFKSEMLGPEHRYMLPAYPAIAILTGNYINKMRCFFNKRWGFFIGDVFSGIIIAVCSFWSLRIAFHAASMADVINLPF